MNTSRGQILLENDCNLYNYSLYCNTINVDVYYLSKQRILPAGLDAEHNTLVHGPSGAHNALRHAHSCIQGTL